MPDWGRDNDVSLGTVDLPVEVSPREASAVVDSNGGSANDKSAGGEPETHSVP